MVGHRYYNPEWGRWIQPDDVEYLEPTNINGLNLYAYCNNDPVNMYDPDGHMPKWAAWLISGGLIVAGVGLAVVSGGASLGPTLSLIAGVASGAAVSAGASSLITGYLNEAAGGSFEAGYIGGMITGAISGAFAGMGGSLISNAVDACLATGTAMAQFLGGMGVSFLGGTLGSFTGGFVTSKIDQTTINYEKLVCLSLVSGGINMIGGYLSGVSGLLMTQSDIMYKLMATHIICITESISQILNYYLSKLF